MIDADKRKGIVLNYLDKGYLVSKECIDTNLCVDVRHLEESDCLIILSDTINIKNAKDCNWLELDRARVMYEKRQNSKIIQKFSAFADKEEIKIVIPEENSVKITYSYDKDTVKKREVADFVTYFNKRYSVIEKILRQRKELENSVSISRILARREKNNVSIIGFVMNKRETRNGHLMLTLEDKTGIIKVLINKDRFELFKQAKELVLDEIIGITGTNGDKIVFANNIFIPDIPTNKELKKSSDEVYALFLSDLHVGSNKFLPDEFNKFLKWINMELGDEKQKKIASKVKYIFIAGDLVDGVGIYPGQEENLVITDIYEQYKECANYLKQIPSHIKMIICPGNHDAMRIAEPQPKFYEDFSKPILDLPNATFVSNPAHVNIHADENFSGFDVMMYHGASFDYYVSNVDSIRNQGGYDKGELIMKFLLQRRHLAPSHSSTPYLPETDHDPLVISKVPDFFVTGHIHKSVVSSYRNVSLICGSCWQSKTSFDEKMGHEPEPARVPIMNLQTRQIKILRFQ